MESKYSCQELFGEGVRNIEMIEKRWGDGLNFKRGTGKN
jgi:hypothetical protein